MVVHCHSEGAANRVVERFARNSRKAGTVTEFTAKKSRVGQHDWGVSVEFRHTCINQGAAVSDAQRFARNCFTGTSYRFSSSVVRSHWSEAAAV